MQKKHEGASQFAITPHRFFTSQSSTTNKEASWQMIYSGWSHTLFFNPTTNTVLGFGKNDSLVAESTSNYDVSWTIPVRAESKIKQVVAGDNHVLILYEDGLLDGYGRGSSGQLGIGCFTNRGLKTVNITLPNNEVAVSIAASGDSSFVISDKGTLYGFGSNSRGVLGLIDESNVEFPTAIPLPEGVIPELIFTAHKRTIVVCKQGELYGFGDNCSRELGVSSPGFSSSQLTPLRLKTFEQLQPRAICIGEYAVVILSVDGRCHFYGIDMGHSLPINYMREPTIILPSDVRPKQISFTHQHLIVLSEQEELWEIGRDSTRVQYNRKDDSRVVKINLPQDSKIRTAIAGYEATFIFNAEGSCYVVGKNYRNNLGLKGQDTYHVPELLPLQSLSWSAKVDKLKTLQVKPCSAASLFLEQEQSSLYPDNTDVIQILEEDDGQIIEILRPLAFNTPLTMSMLYAFYSNASGVPSSQFEHKKIGQNHELVKNHQGTHPVLIVDLGRLDFSSWWRFHDSFERLLAELYLTHRFALFNGYLKKKEYKKEEYQEIATQSGRFTPHNALATLVEYLYKNYEKKVKIFINHADAPFRYSLLSDDYKSIITSLKRSINPILGGSLHKTGNPHVSQTILMGVHPSFLEVSEETPTKRIYTMSTPNPRYTSYFQADPELALVESNHFINTLRISANKCEQIGHLLREDKLEIETVPERAKTPDDVDVIHCLIQLGLLLPTVQEQNTGALSCSIASQAARNILQTLHKKWQIQNMHRITVIFDIDNVLATPDTCTLQTILFFLKKGAVLNVYGVTHYIPPGILELMKFLFSMPMVKVAFFSSGDSKRNEPFVKALLIKALGEQRYSEIASEIKILSGHHMKSNSGYKDEQQHKKYNLPSHSHDEKKDISIAIAQEDTLANAIFVDNNPEFVYYEQEENYLHSETVRSKDFDRLAEDETACNSPNDVLFRKVNAAFYLT